MLSEWLEPIGARLLPLEMLHGLRRRLSGMKHGLVFVFLVSLALVIPGIIIPTFSKIFVDDVLVQNKTTWARPLLLAMALTAVVQAALVYLQNSVLGLLENKLSVRMTASFLLHVLRLPVTFFAGTFAGDVAGRSLHNESVARQLAWELAPKMVRFLAVIFYLLLMAQYDLLLTAVVFGLGLLNLLPRRYLDPRRKKLLQQVDNHRGQLAGVAASGLQDVESVKASAAEADLFSVWAACQTRLANTMQPLEELSVALYAMPALLELLNRSAILGLGGLRVLQGHFTIGDLVAYVALAESFIIPLGELAALGRVTQRIEADLRILDEVLDVPADPGLMLGQPAPTSGPAKLSGHVELRGISFGYDQAAPPLIQAFNLSLTPGKRVALVGGSGSGKSTLARVLAGLYEPWEGEVYFDGQPRRKIPRLLMTQSLMFVDQDIVLFEGTVRENLTLWDATVADEDLVRAARDADIDNVIAARPGGYDSVVAEAGSNFSGGQRQRLEIARALVGNPTILIMDEATSALDSVTEKAIVDNLRRRGCTCVVVAHRLSTIRDCEEILVLERGQVVQRGTHPELYAAGGHYRELITRH